MTFTFGDKILQAIANAERRDQILAEQKQHQIEFERQMNFNEDQAARKDVYDKANLEQNKAQTKIAIENAEQGKINAQRMYDEAKAQTDIMRKTKEQQDELAKASYIPPKMFEEMTGIKTDKPMLWQAMNSFLDAKNQAEQLKAMKEYRALTTAQIAMSQADQALLGKFAKEPDALMPAELSLRPKASITDSLQGGSDAKAQLVGLQDFVSAGPANAMEEFFQSEGDAGRQRIANANTLIAHSESQFKQIDRLVNDYISVTNSKVPYLPNLKQHQNVLALKLKAIDEGMVSVDAKTKAKLISYNNKLLGIMGTMTAEQALKSQYEIQTKSTINENKAASTAAHKE